MSKLVQRTRALVVLGVALVLAVSALPAVAGTTGKISGVVREKGKAGLPGVTVILDGTRFGAIADDQGHYAILNVPSGVYVVRGRIIGYADYVVTNVSVAPDFTTEVNLEMSTDAIQQAPVIVESTRPLIQKDATGTARFLSKDDLQHLPTRGYREAASLQTGVVNFARSYDPRGVERESQNTSSLIVRGGRANEVAYYVDGFSQQDPLTGYSTTNIANNAIDEVVVLTGGFNAEYGRVSSGVVNVVTREGAAKYFGNFEAVTDAGAGSWVGAKRYDWNLYDASIGGPVIPGSDKLTFYASGERRWQGDRGPKFLGANLNTEFQNTLGTEDGRLPNNSLAGWTWQGKLSFRPSDRANLKVGTLGSFDDWREFNQAYLFDSDHMPRYQDRNRSAFATLNYTLSPKSFVSTSVSYFLTERKRGDGVFFDNLPAYSQPSGNPQFDPNLPYFLLPGHVFDDYLRRKSQYWGVKGDWTSQVNRYNQVKAGIGGERHTLRYYDAFFPIQIQYDANGNPIGNLNDIDRYGFDVLGDKEINSGLDGAKHPKTGFLFLQDKFEREGVIVNGGMRFDYINVDTPALRSEQFPLGPAPDDSLQAADLTPNRTYSRLSPRLGVAFPVSDKTLLRVNYGQFYQQINLQDLYVSYQFLQHKIRTGGYFVGFGNPNLKPERTTAYEVGVAQQLGERMRLDATAYYKDVKDLVEIATIASSPNGFSSYRNRDFATIKGLDIGWTMRPMHNVAANMNYSLSYAQGTGSVSNSQRNIAWTASNPPKQSSPLDFDQRHKISANLDWRFGPGEGPSVGGSKILQNAGINLLLSAGSGTPYTPVEVYDEVTLAAVSTVPIGPTNSRYGPWTSTIDMKLNKGFQLGSLNFDAYVWVLNLLDRRNAVAVYESSGSAQTTNWLNTEAGQAFLAQQGAAGQTTYDLAQTNPLLYGNPRLVRFGLRLGF
ncbi:MAG: TonB-dependent receptor [Candidatus Eisenbacteria bacterium]